MRKLLWIFLIFPLALAAQLNNPQVRDSTTDPTGVACTSAAPILRYTAAGTSTMYACTGAGGTVYAAMAGGGSPTTVGGAPLTTIAFGDSITSISPPSGITAAQSYVTLVAGKFGISPSGITDYGVPGYAACDVSGTEAVSNDSPTMVPPSAVPFSHDRYKRHTTTLRKNPLQLREYV